MNLRRMILKNFWLKAGALILAVALWAYVVSRGSSEIGVTAPLELRNVPAGLLVTGEVVNAVEMRLKGQERVLKRLTPDEVAVFINLEGAGPGETVHRLTVQNVDLPANVFVTRITPSVIQLRLDALERRRVSIQGTVSGTPAPGYRIGSVRVVPPDILLEGSRETLKDIRAMPTQPVSVTGAKATVEQEVQLRLPDAEVRLVERVTPRVTVEVLPVSK